MHFFHPAPVLSPSTTNKPAADLPSPPRGRFEQVAPHQAIHVSALPPSAKTRYASVNTSKCLLPFPFNSSHVILHHSGSHTPISPHSRLSLPSSSPQVSSAYLYRPVHQGQIVPHGRRIYPQRRGVPPSLGLLCYQETTAMV